MTFGKSALSLGGQGHFYKPRSPQIGLVRLSSLFLAGALTSERLLSASLVAGLEVERMFLDVLDDVLLLHFAFKAPESTFNGFAFLNFNFCHGSTPPFPRGSDPVAKIASG